MASPAFLGGPGTGREGPQSGRSKEGGLDSSKQRDDRGWDILKGSTRRDPTEVDSVGKRMRVRTGRDQVRGKAPTKGCGRGGSAEVTPWETDCRFTQSFLYFPRFFGLKQAYILVSVTTRSTHEICLLDHEQQLRRENQPQT
jgi:hypothetical protein